MPRPRFKIQCSLESFTNEEIEKLERYGHWLTDLACGKIRPTTEDQRRFVECANKRRNPETIYERAWAKYVSRMKWERRHRPPTRPEKEELRRVYDDRDDWKRMRGAVWGDMIRRARDREK